MGCSASKIEAPEPEGLFFSGVVMLVKTDRRGTRSDLSTLALFSGGDGLIREFGHSCEVPHTGAKPWSRSLASSVTSDEVVQIRGEEPNVAGPLYAGDCSCCAPVIEGARCDIEICGGFFFRQKTGRTFGLLDVCCRSRHDFIFFYALHGLSVPSSSSTYISSRLLILRKAFEDLS